MRASQELTPRLFAATVVLISMCLAPAAVHAQDYRESIDGSWKLSASDDPGFAASDFDDSSWRSVQIPGNIAREKVTPEKIVWLRKTMPLAVSEQNVALLLSAVYDADEIYLNGVLIGKTGNLNSEANQYGRPRIYPIPANLIVNGDNTLAIRVKGSFRGEIGILGSYAEITTTQRANWLIWKKETNSLIFTFIYLISGIFFILLYFRVKEYREYLWYGIFAATFALQQFFRNDLRFSIGNSFLVFKLLEQLAYIALPSIYFYFFINLFKIKTKLFYHAYALINGLTAAAVIVTMRPVMWDKIISIWFFINLPFFAFYLYYTIQKAVKQKDRDAIIISAGTAVMTAATVQFFGVERGFIGGRSFFNTGVLIFNLAIAVALIYRLIQLQKDVEGRQNQLNTVNELRDRVFGYLNTLVRKPADLIAMHCKAVFSPSATQESKENTMKELEIEVDQLQNNLDDILELSRLEVITQPEYVETVNFNDFITAVIPQQSITCYIKVNPAIELNTSLELVNSMVIRLIDFPGFKEFKHIDLIITSDLNQNIHFRFLLYHDDFRQTRKLYELLTSLHPDKGSLWVKWAIVREIIRILSGHMNINIINKKFLRIDITLAARLPEKHTEKRRGERIQIRYVPPADLEGQSGEGLPVQSSPVHYEKLPELSSRMTIGDFIQYLRIRLRRKK